MRIKYYDIERIHVDLVLRDSNFVMPEDHYHPYYELYYVSHGTCCFFLKDTIYEMKQGDFILIAPRELHHTLYLDNASCERIAIYFRRSDIMTADFPELPNFKERFLTSSVFSVPDIYQTQIMHIINQMLSEEKLMDDASDYMMKLLLKQLLLTCNRYCTLAQDTLARISTNDSDVLAAAKYISLHYTEPISLETIASIAGLSPTYFSKKFKATTGLGFREYLIYARLKKASLELLTTSDSITNIALNCGFSNSNYFKDAFKNAYGLSPREFRKVGNTDI